MGRNQVSHTDAQQIPLFIMAGRNNPLINWLNLSFDSFNLLHRWFGRIVVIEAIVHGAAYTASVVSTGGWPSIEKDVMGGDPMVMYGFIVRIMVRVSPGETLTHYRRS